MTAVLPLARRELIRFFRQRSRVVGAVVPPIFVWLLIGTGFGGSFRHAAGTDFLGYFFPGTIVLVVLFAAIFSTISVIEDRREGFLQGVLVSPAPPSSIALGKVLGATALGLLQGAVLLAAIPFLSLEVDAAALLAALGVLSLVSIALTGLGFSIAWMLESTQGFHAIMNLFLIPLWLLSGAFFPVEGAPLWLQRAMAVNPLTYGVAALRRALAPNTAEALPSLPLSAAVTAVFAAAMLAVSVLVVARYPTGPDRRLRRTR